MNDHKVSTGLDIVAVDPPLAPHWYGDTEALIYRQAYLEGYTQGGIDMARNMRGKRSDA